MTPPMTTVVEPDTDAQSACGTPRGDAAMARLSGVLEGMGRALVAYSGGADSGLLLNASVRVLGRDAVTSVLVDTPLLGEGEAAEARNRAARWGVEVEVLRMDPLSLPEVAENSEDRCYVCKRMVFGRLAALAADRAIPWVAEGSHEDDARSHRPGMAALRELGIRSPLLEAGLDKEAVRGLGRALGLEGWDRPSAPCLATRFPYGTRLTVEALRRVDRAESAIRAEGYPILRVRSHGDTARVEVPRERLRDLVEEPARSRVVAILRGCGFRFTALDMEGFRSGSMDGAMPNPVAEPREP